MVPTLNTTAPESSAFRRISTAGSRLAPAQRTTADLCRPSAFAINTLLRVTHRSYRQSGEPCCTPHGDGMGHFSASAKCACTAHNTHCVAQYTLRHSVLLISLLSRYHMCTVPGPLLQFRVPVQQKIIDGKIDALLASSALSRFTYHCCADELGKQTGGDISMLYHHFLHG